MQKNVASQKWTVFAFNRTNNVPVTGDAANITAKIGKDGAALAATNDVNPTETEDGFYEFDLTQAETNANKLVLTPESSTSNVQVIGVPGVIYTNPANYQSMGIETDGHVHGDVKEVGGTAQTAGNIIGNIGALNVAASTGDPGTSTTLVAYLKQLINILIGTAGIATFPTESAPANAVSLAEVIRAIHADVTGLNGAAMRGTDNAALASVLGALTTAAHTGDPNTSTTAIAYIKQLVNILAGSDGIATFPAAANPANAVSMAEVLRSIHVATAGLAGAAMRGTDNALLATSAPANFADLAITVTTGRVSVGTNFDKTGYSISGSKTTLDALNDLSAAQVNTEVDTALSDANLDHLVGTAAGIPAVPSGTFLDQIMRTAAGTFDRATDSLEAIRDRGDAAWITGSAPSAASIADAVLDEALSGHVGAGSLGKAIADIEADTNELQTDNVPGLIAALNNLSTTDVDARLTNYFETVTHAQPSVAAPPTSPSKLEMWNYMYVGFTHKKIENATGGEVYANDGTTILFKYTHTYDDTLKVYTKNAMISG